MACPYPALDLPESVILLGTEGEQVVAARVGHPILNHVGAPLSVVSGDEGDVGLGFGVGVDVIAWEGSGKVWG